MNDLVAGGTGPSRELAKHVLASGAWNTTEALAKFGGLQLQATRAALYEQLVPLKNIEPKLDGRHSDELRQYLRVIGCKVRPDFSGDQAQAWLGAVLTALSDLPPRCTARALLDAMHVPFQFVNEAEAKVRELAEAEREKQNRAIRRLDAMQAELHRATNTQRQIEDRTSKPLSTADVHALQRGPMGKELVRLGLAIGEIQPEQLLPPEELQPPEQE